MADNLLDKASILLTPTAYNDGRMLSVKPNENLYGSELVTNGDFSQGSQDWTFNTNGNNQWSVANEKASYLGTATDFIITNNVLTIGKKYLVSFDILDTNGSTIRLSVNSEAGGSFDNYTNGDGKYTTYLTANTNYLRIGASSSGASFSIDNVSVKEDLTGDFTFSRSSAATRVNAQGLVENVQIISDELVSNGNFSQEGSELVTNGDFATDSDWTLGIGWSIGDGKAVSVPSGGGVGISQGIGFTSGKTYKVEYTIQDYVQGNVRPSFSGGGTVTGTVNNGNGTYIQYLTATANHNTFNIKSTGTDGGFEGSITNISVKEVGQDWIFDEWALHDDNGDLKVEFIGSTSAQYLKQENVYTPNSKIRLQFNVSNLTSGGFEIISTGVVWSTSVISANGNYIFDIDTNGVNNGHIYLRANGGVFDGYVDNISVKEITDDTDLPRIDYTDGCGSWLLEPQSTNLSTKSENISGWGFPINVTTTQNYGTSPDGSVNSTRLQFTSNGFMNDGLTLTSGTEYTLSIYAKRNDTGTQSFGFYVDGTPTIVGGITLTDEWQRFTYTYTASSSSSIGLAGDSGADVSVFGFQTEQQSYATSYIPTNGSIATRLADVATNSGNSTLINSTEGVLYAEIAALADGTTRRLCLSDGTSSQKVLITFSSTTNRIQFEVINSTNQFYKEYVSSDLLDFHKLAIKYKQNDFSVYVNGSKIHSSTSGNVPSALSKLSFDNGIGSQNFYGKAKALAVYKEALTDAQLQSLTTI